METIGGNTIGIHNSDKYYRVTKNFVNRIVQTINTQGNSVNGGNVNTLFSFIPQRLITDGETFKKINLMKFIALIGLLTLMSFKTKQGDDPPVRTNHLVGTNIYEKTDKKSLDALLALCLKDKETSSKIERILAESNLTGNFCFGVWDDMETFCFKRNNQKKGGVCSAGTFILNDFTWYQRYLVLYNCETGDLYGAWLI